jgi:hypothetical protein
LVKNLPGDTIQDMEWTPGRFFFFVRHKFASFFLFLFLSFLVYGNAIHNEFIGDDVGRIAENQQYQYGRGLGVALAEVMPDRPFLVFVNWLNYKITGITPVGFKAVSIILHGTCAFALFLLLCRLGKHWQLGHNRKISFFVAALFVAHPALNQTINLTIQRGVILSTLFGILSFYFFLGYQESKSRETYLVSVFCFFIAVLSKPFALVWPFIFLCYYWCFRKSSSSKDSKETVVQILIFFAFAIVPIAFYKVMGVNVQNKALPWFKYLAIQTRVIFVYLKLFFFPVGLRYSYDLSLDTRLTQNLTWLAVCGHVAILGTAYFLKKKLQEPMLAFALFSAYIAFAPESSIFPIEHVIFEHRIYFPYVFIFMALWAVLQKFNHRITTSSLVVCGVVLVLTGTVLNWKRSAEISTLKKWISNLFKYNPNDTSAKHWALLYSLSVRDYKYGLELVETMLKQEPQSEVFSVFKGMFEYPTLDSNAQKKVLDKLAWHMRNETPGTFLPALYRVNFISFILERLREHVSEEKALRLAENLIYYQMPLFVKDLKDAHGLVVIYAHVNESLKQLLVATLKTQRKLSEEDLRTYLRVLAGADLFLGDNQGELTGKYKEAIKQFPKSKLFSTDFDFYLKNKNALQ